jgi:hypothetical protein
VPRALNMPAVLLFADFKRCPVFEDIDMPVSKECPFTFITYYQADRRTNLHKLVMKLRIFNNNIDILDIGEFISILMETEYRHCPKYESKNHSSTYIVVLKRS